MEEQGSNEDLRRQGISAVASLMGHVAAATGERLEASKVFVSGLSAESLQAADEYLQICLAALRDPEMLAALPEDERAAFQDQRMSAIMTAFDVVSSALEKR